MLTARVVDGVLDVPKGLLEEGTTVTVLVPEEEEAVELTDEEAATLRESFAQIERGEWVDGWALLDEIRRA